MRARPHITCLTIADRAALYNESEYGRRYPDSQLRVGVHGMLSGVWLLGNQYRGSGYYGAHPPQYLGRITTLFPDCRPVMHLFSGSLPQGDYVRVDANKANTPDLVADAHDLAQHFHSSQRFRIIYADPPYNKEAAAIYGYRMINRRTVLQQCHELLMPGGFVVWLDTVWPMAKKTKLPLVGLINVVRSQNHMVRDVFIMQKKGK